MKIVIIGTGHAAHALARKIAGTPHEIVAIGGRDQQEAKSLARKIHTHHFPWPGEVPPSDICLLCVSDDAIPKLASQLRLPDTTVAHCAGSVSMSVLKPISSRIGVFYPLQSLRKEIISLPVIPVCINGNTEAVQQQLASLAMAMSGDQYVVCDDSTRLHLHIAAVFVNNFVNHLYAEAEDFCRKEGIDFTMLRPLILETSNRIRNLSPALSQTGPAIRHDELTIRKHLEQLEKHPQLKSLYEVLTASIQGMK